MSESLDDQETDEQQFTGKPRDRLYHEICAEYLAVDYERFNKIFFDKLVKAGFPIHKDDDDQHSSIFHRQTEICDGCGKLIYYLNYKLGSDIKYATIFNEVVEALKKQNMSIEEITKCNCSEPYPL
jgi:hypothetical protein